MFVNSSWIDEDPGEPDVLKWPTAFSFSGIFNKILSGKPFEQLFKDQTDQIYQYDQFYKMRRIGFVPPIVNGWLDHYNGDRWWFEPLPGPYPNEGRYYVNHGPNLPTVAPYIQSMNQDQLISDILSMGGPAPVANAGADQTVSTDGQTALVTLDAAGSYHPGADGLLLNYNAWSYVWTNCATGTVLASGINPAVELPLGVNTICLTLRDGYRSAEDSVTIVVVDAHPADINDDGEVDLKDYAILAAQWLRQPSEDFSADIAPSTGDGVVDILDLGVLASDWLWQE